MRPVDSCPACRGAVAAWHGPGSGMVYCPSCDVAVRDPMPDAAELDELYRRHYGEDRIARGETDMETPGFVLDRYASFLARRFLPASPRLVEIGASTGYLANRLRELGFEVEGVELSARARARAHAQYGLSFHDSVAALPRDSFDLLVAIEVIEHFPDPWRALSEWRSMLAPGGWVFITTPNRGGLTARLQKARWREAAKPYHLVLFSRRGLKTALERAGFENPRALRFGPITSADPMHRMLHRSLQLFDLYGGLRVVAARPRETGG